MGKGKGKMRGFIGTIGSGRILYEFKYFNIMSVRILRTYFSRYFGNTFQYLESLNLKRCYGVTGVPSINRYSFENLITRKRRISKILHWRLRNHIYSI